MPRLSRATWIAEHDRYAQRRHDDFRRAALAVATAFAERPEVRAVSLFGSVARPLETFITSRRHWELLHDPKDVDLAVWIDRLDDLKGLQRARSAALNRLLETEQIGVAHHQVDVFLFEPGSDAYLGRLCGYGVCPKGKPDCSTPGCGRHPFLKQHEDFVLDPAALAPDRAIRLYHAADGGTGPG